MSFLLAMAVILAGTFVFAGLWFRWANAGALDEGQQSELERREVAAMRNRRFEREAAQRAYESAERTAERVAKEEPCPPVLDGERSDAEEVRDGLLAHLAKLSGLNLSGPKGESRIRHGKALPTSVLETFDRGRSLFCELKGMGSHYGLVLRLQLQQKSNVQLRIRRARAVSRETVRWTQDLTTGDERFDRTYLLEGKGFVSIEPLQELEEARRAVEAVFALNGMETLTIRGELLRIEGEIEAELDREDLAGLLPALRTLAAIYEGETSFGVDLKAHAVAGTGGLCPYCRDTFAGELEVIECSGCGTALHHECHEENGGCPVLGCGVQTTVTLGGPALPQSS